MSSIHDHRAAIVRLSALAVGASAEKVAMLRAYVEFHEDQITRMEASPVRVYGPVGNEHRTRSNILPDIRIDPPYDR